MIDRAMLSYRLIWALSFTALPCIGQSWSLGIAGGGGWYHDVIVKNAAESASAGFEPNVAASAVLTQDTAEYFGGELRYTFRGGDSRLRASSSEANMDAFSHAVHYEFLAYFTPRHSRIRPYAAGGAGIKYYDATGREDPAQPLSNFALLTRSHEVEPLISFGGGIKVALAERWLVRFDVRDYATPFPEKLFAPAPGARIDGWLHDIVALVGVDWVFRNR